MVHRCSPCQLNRSKPALAPVHPWVWPTRVWQRIHIDFAGPFLGHMFLLVIDSHSEWLEVEILPIKVSSERTIQCLRSLFARYGLPDQLVSDHGPQSVSHAFKQFTRNNGVKHIRTSPRHPTSNGAVERSVRTFKDFFKKPEGKLLVIRSKN